MKRFLLLFALCSSPVLADSLDTFTFLPHLGIPSFTVPSDIGPQFSLTINGTQWNFFFTDGDHFVDVDYTALYVSTGTTPVLEGGLIDFPYYCAPWNVGCTEVGKPWDASTRQFVSGDYISMTITTPEPATVTLLLIALLLLRAFYLKANVCRLNH